MNSTNDLDEFDDLDDDASAPGWDAIDAALKTVYPDQEEAIHFGSIPFSFLGARELDGISVHRAAEPTPHWHYVSYGLSDLYGEQEGPDEYGDSGYGFELTFRLADPQALTAEEPPSWPASLMQNLGRYVFNTGNCFAPNHHMDMGGKIGLEEETDLTAIGFVLDPDLGEIETPSGKVRFLQLFGLTGTDLDDVKAWSAEPLYELYATRHPKYVTDLASGPLRDDPEVARLIDEGKQRDGSQMGRTFVESVKVAEVEGRLEITIGARVAGEVPGSLMGRLPFGRDFMLIGNEDGLTFESAESTSWELGEEENFLRLTPADLEQVVAVLEPKRGRHEAPAGVVWIIEPTEMRDPDGNVVEVIG